MPEPVGGISSRSPNSSISSALTKPDIAAPSVKAQAYASNDSDQFLKTWGTFAFDNQLKNNERARNIADAIFSIVSPLTRGPRSIEDRLACLSLQINNCSERDKKRKIEDLITLAKHRSELQKSATERTLSEQNALAAREQNMHNALQHTAQSTSQEIQTVSSLTNGRHEAIMSLLRQS